MWRIIICFIGLLSVLGCDNQDAGFAGRGDVSKQVDLTKVESTQVSSPTINSDPATTVINPDSALPDTIIDAPSPNQLKEFRFQINDMEDVTPGKAVDIIFLIDNSASMSDKVTRLQSSVKKFVSNIKTVKSSGLYIGTMLLSDFVYGTYRTNFTFDAKSTVNNILSSSTRDFEIKHNAISAPLAWHSPFSLLSPDGQWAVEPSLDREPMLAAAMALLNKRKYEQVKLKSPQLDSTHIILLSDEDNDPQLSARSIVADQPDVAYQTDFYYLSHKSVLKSNCEQLNLALPGQPFQYELIGDRVCNSPEFDPDFILTSIADAEYSHWECHSDMTRSKSKDELKTLIAEGALTISAKELPQGARHCQVPVSYRCFFNSDGSIVSSDVNSRFYYNVQGGNYSRCEASSKNSLWLLSGSEFDNLTVNWPTDLFGPIPECRPASCKFAWKYPLYRLSYSNERLVEITTDPCPNGSITLNQSKAGKLRSPRGSWYFCPQELPDGEKSVFATKVSISKSADVASSTEFVSYVNVATPTNKETVLQLVADHHKIAQAELSILYEPTLPRQGFLNNADGFLQFLKVVHPDVDVKVHSIVNLDGKACAGEEAQAGNLAAGNQYVSVSKATGGKILDICKPSFDGFLNDVADVVSRQLVQSYPLAEIIPADHQKIKILSLRNLTRGEDLPADAWAVQDAVLTIDRSKIANGDEIVLNAQSN